MSTESKELYDALVTGEAGNIEPRTNLEAYLKYMAVNKSGGSATAGPVSWNDLTDKPFGEETTVINEPLNVAWDGNTEGLLMVDSAPLVRVSAAKLTDEQIQLCTIAIDGGPSIQVSELWADLAGGGVTDEYVLVSDGDILFIKKENVQVPELEATFPKAGIYTWTDMNNFSITTVEPVEYTETEVQKIDEKYLPGCVTKFYVTQGDEYIYTSSSVSEESRAHSSDIYEAITHGPIVVYSVYEDGNTRFIAYPTSIEPGLSGCWITVANSYNTYGYHTSDWEANVS